MMRLHDFLDYQTRQNPNLDFAIFQNQSLSYAEANALINQFANALLESGLNKGDRLAYLSKNSLEYPIVFYGCAKAGIVPVPLNFRLAPPEWAYIINDAQAKSLLVSPEYASQVNAIKNQLNTVNQYVLVAPKDHQPEPEHQEYTQFHPWIAAMPQTDPPANVLPTDDLYQMYTSGTTGHPKGAVLKHQAVAEHAHQFQYMLPRHPGDRTLVVAPLYHAAAGITMIAAIATGGTIYIMEDFHPGEVVRALSEENIAHATLVPAMIQACLVMVPDVAQRDYSALRTIAYGASPIAEQTLRQALQVFKCQFTQAYGMTETTAVLTCLTHHDHQQALDGKTLLLLSAGRPLLGTQVKIVDESGNEVPPGTIGEICGRGPQLMNGYWNLPDATQRALQNGWMHTGDAGRIDEQGFLYVEDRVKDMIITGGENVYPREVENCLFQHPAVADCAVIGIPSEQWGETVKAIICLKQDQSPTEEELIEHCRNNIAHYKCPTSVDFIPELPRNASGKVLKRELREKYWQGHTRRVS